MPKHDFDVSFAAAVQDDEGTYEPGLGAITTALSGHGGQANTDDGLLLGDPEQGINESGLSLVMGRRAREKAFVGGSFTRPISDQLAAEVRTLTFGFPFCGNRDDAAGTIIAADTVPLVGIDAILAGCGMFPAVSGVGTLYRFLADPGPPVSLYSCLVHYFGNKLELLDCRTSSLAITFTPGSITTALATIEAGSVQLPTGLNPTVVAQPTLTYADQADVSAPTIETVAHGWNATRGFSSLVLTITPNVIDVPDSNAEDGIVKEVDGREVTIAATMFSDDAGTNETYELGQLFAATAGELDALTFQVGVTGTDNNPVKAVAITIPQPEVDTAAMEALGSKAANTVLLKARHGTANLETDILFK